MGQYNSALSNSAVIAGRKFGYFVWGIDDESHEIVATFFNCNKDVKNEPIKHYLSRLINPDINFVFDELTINNKRVVVLSIPAASSVPTFYKGERYIRISSSKANLKKYHQKKHIYLKFFDRVFLR